MRSFLILSLLAAMVAPASAQGVPQKIMGADLSDSMVKPSGAFVGAVQAGSKMAAAGLLAGDVITGVDGQKVAGADSFAEIILSHRAGDTLHFDVQHLGKPARFTVVLPDLPGLRKGPAAPAPVMAAARPGPMPQAGRPAPSQPPQAAERWATYSDPAENAFSLSVPAGWRVSGGSRRMNAVEIRTGVDAVSPDGRIHLFYGDASVPIFTVPSPMLNAAGLRPGMTYNPGQGVSMLIQPYASGQQFAAGWGAGRMGRDCAGARVLRSQARPDSSQAISSAYGAGGIQTSIAAGEASFSCSLNGAPAQGYVFAGTELVRAPASAMWDVKSLVGFVATADRVAEATDLLSHMVASFTINPAWIQRQQGITAQFSRITEETNRAVSSAIIANGRAQAAASDAIFARGQSNSRDSTAAVDRYDENAVRGTSTYVNPETGTERQLDNSYSHTYTDPSGNIRQTNSENAPGPGWTELQRK